MDGEYNIIDITPSNVDEYDMFCKKSKKKEDGYQQKLEWFHERYKEGLRIKLLQVNDGGKMTSRGFSEYIPGEYSWRAVHASGHMLIHCHWVVGKWKKKGFGTMLLDACISDAKQAGLDGVATVTSDMTWLTGKKLFLKNGFDLVDTTPPGFELLVKQFKDVAPPSFPRNWDRRLKSCGEGLTVVYTKQCPYQPDATKLILEAAEDIGVKARAVELKSAAEIHEKAPSAYGVYSIVYNGHLLSHSYINKKRLQELVEKAT